MRLRRLSVALLPLVFSACLSGTDYSTNLTPAVPIEQTTFAASLNVDLTQSTKTASGLYIRDLTVGTGAAATSVYPTSVYYAGYLATGQRFDFRASPSQPFAITAASGRVIAGWEEGIVGMKVGGTRQLIIPPSLAYGAAGDPPVIPANAVLVFTVELVSIP